MQAQKIKQKLNTLLFRFGFLVVLATACQTNTNSLPEKENYLFVDDYNREVHVPKNPKRIVSVSPAITEIIFALHGNERLIGRTDYCTYPNDALAIESIGGINNLNVEKLFALAPDLVIIGSMVPENTANIIAKAGIPLVAIREKATFEALFENIRKIGMLIGNEEEAAKLNKNLQNQVQKITSSLKADSNHKPTVYYVVGFGKGGNFTAGGNTFITDIFSIAGTQNIASNITGWSYSVEALLKADPEYIFVRKEDAEAFVQTYPYNNLSAVKKGRVIPIESVYLDLQVPRNIDALVFIYQATHPLTTN